MQSTQKAEQSLKHQTKIKKLQIKRGSIQNWLKFYYILYLISYILYIIFIFILTKATMNKNY
jgi:uncharacterized membrane protein